MENGRLQSDLPEVCHGATAGVKRYEDGGEENRVSGQVLSSSRGASHLKVPVIDFKDLHEDIGRRKGVIGEVKHASETWGFFQAVNHGVPEEFREEMLAGLRRFFELPEEMKEKHFRGGKGQKVNYNRACGTHRRNSLYMSMSPVAPDPEEIPAECREIAIRYFELVKEFAISVLELLSEALQLKPSYLVEMGCAEGLNMSCHFYGTCADSAPDLGLPSHKDVSFIGILLQDRTGGLQVLHQNEWVDVTPIPGAFVVNIGDIMQLITNDKFKSTEHRVMSNHITPRISVTSFLFSGNPRFDDRLYGPIKELVSAENPPLYKHILIRDYVAMYASHGPDGTNRGLDNYRL